MGFVSPLNLGGTSIGEDKSTAQVYYVKNKDRVLAEFVWEDEEYASLQKDLGLPSFISSGFNKWISTRTPPSHRANMKELLDSIGLHTTKGVIDYSRGLALTDTLWITVDPGLFWDSVSLFRNEFDEVIARTAFDGGLYGHPFSTTTPEFSTNGMLAKCWTRDNDGTVCLVKTGTTGASNAGNEPYSEVLAHQVLERLGYNHVPYYVKKYNGRLVSVCPLFTSEELMLVPIYLVDNECTLGTMGAFARLHGISTGFAQYLIFDYLSWNTDRHAGNIGVLLNSDTFEVVDFAPIYDNGVSMLNYWNGTDDIKEYVTRSTPALYRSFEQGAKFGKDILGSRHNVRSLINFKFDRSAVPGYPDDRIDAIEEFLQWRVHKFLEM